MLKRVSKAVKIFVVNCSDDNPDAVIDFYKQYVLTDTQSSELCVRLLIAGKHECARRIPKLDLNKSFAIAYRWESIDALYHIIDMGSTAMEWETFCRFGLHDRITTMSISASQKTTFQWLLERFVYSRVCARKRALILLWIPAASRPGSGVGITKDVARIIARVVWSLRKFN